MRISELLEKRQKSGTYAGVRFSPSTNKLIHKFVNTYSIPNAVKPNKLHTTVLLSRKPCPNYKPLGKLLPPMYGEAEEFVVWPTRGENGPPSKCLVLKYKCPELSDRHTSLMKQHEATYDYDEYVPHVTLSYDIGDDFDIASLNKANILNSLNKLEIAEEYYEPLDEGGWADKATKWSS